jgi:uncharacterized membrane protein YeaQ/YmgE (transglycosylase-associated protein family)
VGSGTRARCFRRRCPHRHTDPTSRSLAREKSSALPPRRNLYLFWSFRWGEKEKNMGVIILLVVGGLIGWVASILMRTDAQQGVLLNIVVGIVGALIAGFLLNPLIGGGNIMNDSLDISAILVSLLGAVVLLGIVNLFRRGTVR